MLKEKWHNFKQKATWRNVVGAAIASVTILLLSYAICNTSIPLPDEMKVLQSWDTFKSINGFNKDSIPDDVLLVNVTYDKQLVDYARDGIPLGQYAITDRKKLLDFLRAAQAADDYKYILLDVIFEKGIESPFDSALFHQIASMQRIVIPVHRDVLLQDTVLYQKAACADYTVTWKDTNFARFKYRWDDLPSIPLRMYQDLDGKTISKHGFLYTSNGWLCQNGLTLQFPIRITGDMDVGGYTMMKFNVLQLGADLMALDSIAPIANEIKDKIVVIGDFYTDIHDTYVGPQAGSIICLNAYYALQRGEHILFGKFGLRLIFYILVAFVYFIMALCYLTGVSLSSFTELLWLKSVISFGGIGLLYWIVAILGYIFFDTVYNLWIPITFFSVLSVTINVYSRIKELKHEKIKTDSVSAATSADYSTGEQLQGAISELSEHQH